MAEENVQKLLDMLYEMIDEAKNAPLSNDKCVLNRDEALDLLDEIRAQMPVELKRAQSSSAPATSMWRPPSATSSA